MLEGNPDAVLATARRFRQVSDDIGEIHGRLDRGGLSGSWEGPAADAFRATVSDLPGELSKASHVNGQVADALFSFGHTLADLQARSREADRALADAQARASLAQSDDTRAHAALKTAQRAYLTAIVMIDLENVEKFAQDRDIPFSNYTSLTRAQPVMDLVWSEIERVNAKFARVEQIKKFCLLETQLSAEDEELTPTMKLKRKLVEKKYADRIDAMYGG